MKVVFDAIFYDNRSSATCSTMGMLCIMYRVIRNFETAFLSEVCFRNQHGVYFLILYVVFYFFNVPGEPVGVP